MALGFVYVLINPAMPGLAKVGKTTRTPAQRLAELSSATGVPSPFILAYEQPVADCHAAEQFVHSELERRGCRLSEGREFFSAPLHEIVSVVAIAASLNSVAPQVEQQEPSVELGNPDDIAQQLASLADAYRYGDRDVLRNFRKALKLYEQAALAGDSHSCESAAELLQGGAEGIQPDPARAIEYYKRAISLDPQYRWYLNADIATIYSVAGQPDSALPYWKKFVIHLTPDANRRYADMLWRYCFDVANRGVPHELPDDILGLFGPELIDKVNGAVALGELDGHQGQQTKDFITEVVGRGWQ